MEGEEVIASLTPYHGFLWGVGSGIVLIIVAVVIWNWRHPE